MPGPGCECGTCKTCYQRQWRAKNPDKVKAAKAEWGKTRNRAGDPATIAQGKRWYEANKAKIAEKQRQEWRSNPLKKTARNKLNYAIRKGYITRQPCEVCGERKVHAHHDDYTKPLEVRWLCGHHHALLHRRVS